LQHAKIVKKTSKTDQNRSKSIKNRKKRAKTVRFSLAYLNILTPQPPWR